MLGWRIVRLRLHGSMAPILVVSTFDAPDQLHVAWTRRDQCSNWTLHARSCPPSSILSLDTVAHSVETFIFRPSFDVPGEPVGLMTDRSSDSIVAAIVSSRNAIANQGTSYRYSSIWLVRDVFFSLWAWTSSPALRAITVTCARAAAKDVFSARHASLNTMMFLANNFVQIHIGPCLLAQVLNNLLSSVLQEALAGKCRSLQKWSTASPSGIGCRLYTGGR